MELRFKNGSTAWEDFKEHVNQIIIEEKYKTVAEIGGGANPLLSLDFVESHQLKYHVIDLSSEELNKADERYSKIILNIQEPGILTNTQYDFIFAQMTLEHISNPAIFYSNIYKSLRPGGKAFFFFACISSLPSLINLITPEIISEIILIALQPFRKNEKHGKFKAYYKWCLGPVKKNIRRLHQLNFKVESYIGYFGHSYYEKFGYLNYLENLKTGILLKHPNPYFCSYAQVVLRKE